MTVPLALAYGGKDTSIFAYTKTLYSAADFMLTVLLCGKDISLVPQKGFGFLLLLS
jgi:hypothetical protein